MSLSRRAVLAGGSAGIGLIVAFALWPRSPGPLPLEPGEKGFGNFLKVAKDGKVTLAVPQVETGQGIWTGLAQIVADELGASWDRVAVEPAPLGGDYANPLVGDGELRITAASTSIRAFEAPLRHAAAAARSMLVGAAADRWGVAPGECESADNMVMNRGRSFSFGELAEEAAERSVPSDPPLRSARERRLIGRPLPRLDGPSKCDGSWRFAVDVRLPAMLFASARLAPPGGRLSSFDRAAVNRIAGVRHLHAEDDAFAVIADNWWAAEQAVKAANPRFSGPVGPGDIRRLFEAALAKPGTTSFERGDYDGAVRGSRPLAATYYAAPALHLGLEPLSATARIVDGGIEVWAATLAPEAARQAAERAAPGANVAFFPLPPGEPGGRALTADLVPLAIALARAAGRPVQLMLSQSASQNHDRPSGGAMARMSALPGAGGITAAWKMKLAAADGFGAALSALENHKPEKLGATGLSGSIPPYAIPNVAIEAVPAEVPFRAGYMRSSPEREFAFFTESFIDELARAAGMEPLAFRMSLLGGNPRLANCLQTAARAAGWDGGSAGSRMGIVGASAFGSTIALVAEAGLGPDRRIKVERLVAAVDCGRVVNRGLVVHQVEAGLIWALGQATAAEPDWVAAMPKARPFGHIALPRLVDAPRIMVEIIASSAPPGGVSGLAATVLAPAVANAMHAATGQRLRSLPFAPMAAQ